MHFPWSVVKLKDLLKVSKKELPVGDLKLNSNVITNFQEVVFNIEWERILHSADDPLVDMLNSGQRPDMFLGIPISYLEI